MTLPEECTCDGLVHHGLDGKGNRNRPCSVCEQRSSLSPDPGGRLLRRGQCAILNQMVDEIQSVEKRRRPNKKRRRGYRGPQTVLYYANHGGEL